MSQQAVERFGIALLLSGSSRRGSAPSQTESGDPRACAAGLFPFIVNEPVGIIPAIKKVDRVSFCCMVVVSNCPYNSC